MVRLAPVSASNHQPWPIVAADRAWHFYLQRTPRYLTNPVIKAVGIADLQRFIWCIAHVPLGAGVPGGRHCRRMARARSANGCARRAHRVRCQLAGAVTAPCVLEKVTAFVVRAAGGASELLLFEHPYAGVQVPAGTVQEAEPLQSAVLREAREETGLTGLALVRYLGSAPSGLPGDYRGICRKATVYARPDASSFGWAHVPHGAMVRLLGRTANGYVHVAFEEYDHERERRYLTYGISGWVQGEHLAERLDRHFFLLACEGSTPERWTVETDNHVFTCFWAPLDRLPALASPQDRWLAFLHSPQEEIWPRQVALLLYPE